MATTIPMAKPDGATIMLEAELRGRIDGEGHRRMDQTPHHLRSLCGEPARFGAAIYTSVHCPVGIVRCD